MQTFEWIILLLLGAALLAAARERVHELRRDGSIGDAAFRVLVQELDWAELSAGAGRHE